METKKIIGITVLAVSVGVFVFILKGYIQPKIEVDKEFEQGTTVTTK
jgi:hypothetical protein